MRIGIEFSKMFARIKIEKKTSRQPNFIGRFFVHRLPV
jgi:hypothetical protein